MFYNEGKKMFNIAFHNESIEHGCCTKHKKLVDFSARVSREKKKNLLQVTYLFYLLR